MDAVLTTQQHLKACGGLLRSERREGCGEGGPGVGGGLAQLGDHHGLEAVETVGFCFQGGDAPVRSGSYASRRRMPG